MVQNLIHLSNSFSSTGDKICKFPCAWFLGFLVSLRPIVFAKCLLANSLHELLLCCLSDTFVLVSINFLKGFDN